MLRSRAWLAALLTASLALPACDRGADLRDVLPDRTDATQADVVDDLRADGLADAVDDTIADAPADVFDAALDVPSDAVFDAWTDAAAEASDAPDSDPPLFVDAGCGATYASFTPAMGVHVPPDASIMWTTNPPSSGDHYPFWARWGMHSTYVPRGYWVHNLEHGGVAVLYRCESDCDALRAQLAAFVASLPPEAQCVMEMDGGPTFRIIVTEDPEIDSPIAAAAWGYTYHANCFDAPSLRAFVLGRVGHGPEDSCAEGFYP